VYILEPIGSIMDVNRPRIALGAWDEAAYECAFEAIWSIRDQWHTIRIDEKLEQDPEVVLLRRFAERHALVLRQAFSHLCPYLNLKQDWETFLASRGSKMRKNLRAGFRKLEAMGAVTLELLQSPAEIAMGYGVVLKLHANSWKRKKKVEHSHGDDYRSFYAGWLQSMARQNQARILVLRCSGNPVAATVAFTDAQTYYSAQIVHDSRYAACSPGTLLEARELECLMQEQRFENYDLLGSFLNNKMRWTETALSTTYVFVFRPALRTKLFDTYYFKLKPRIRPYLLPLLQKLGKDKGVS
jgi:CelD/BcsL family acetyltransferase involved in cellulose biosynthesis